MRGTILCLAAVTMGALAQAHAKATGQSVKLEDFVPAATGGAERHRP